MTTFIMMCGLVGSGKSFQAKKLALKYNAVVIESDAVRKELYGDAATQGDNNALFNSIHKEIVRLLSEEKNVILDATNISYKHRVALLDKLKKINVTKACYLMATQYKTCLEQNKNRDREVPEYVIKRMRESFTCPQYNEGWDKIEIVYNYDKNDYDMDDYLKEIENFQQDNPHHTKTLGEHVKTVAQKIDTRRESTELLYYVALLHDNGKRYTKVFHNMKDEPSETSHYYNHENVGAYEALFYLKEFFDLPENILYGCGLIQYHMRPYKLETEKAKYKLLRLVGEEMYNDLIVLNKADAIMH